jgi:hypothetical protein
VRPGVETAKSRSPDSIILTTDAGDVEDPEETGAVCASCRFFFMANGSGLSTTPRIDSDNECSSGLEKVPPLERKLAVDVSPIHE